MPGGGGLPPWYTATDAAVKREEQRCKNASKKNKRKNAKQNPQKRRIQEPNRRESDPCRVRIARKRPGVKRLGVMQEDARKEGGGVGLLRRGHVAS